MFGPLIRRVLEQPERVRGDLDPDTISYSFETGGQMAERLGNRAFNQKVAGSILGQMTLCPWERHLTLLAAAGISLYLL